MAGLCLAAAVAQASDVADKYPEKMVRIIVPYAPGGFNDTLGRIFAQQGVETLGGSPEDFEQFFQDQMSKWSKVVEETGITAY